MKRHLALVGLLVAAAGCASGTSSNGKPAAANSDTVTVTANDEFRFAPAHVDVNAGDVTVRLLASGSYPHNISFPQLHVTSVTVGTSIGEPHSTLVQLAGLRPGTYRFLCTFHSKAGMTGELVVH